MDDHDHSDVEHGEATDTELEKRTTAPQSGYSMRDVGVGFVVMAVGLVVTFVVPYALA